MSAYEDVFGERDEQAKATARGRNCREGACRAGTRKSTAVDAMGTERCSVYDGLR